MRRKQSVIFDQIRDISEKNLSTNRNQIAFTLLAVLFFSAVLLQDFFSLPLSF